MENNKYNIFFTPEALDDIKNLDTQNEKRAMRTIRLFEIFGSDAVNSKRLDDNGLFELKCDKVRIYFSYYWGRLVIIGLVTLKKTQKAPPRYIIAAYARIDKFIKSRQGNI